MDNDTIWRHIEERRVIEDEESSRTKAARRSAQKTKNNARGTTPATVLLGQQRDSLPRPQPVLPVDDAWGDDDDVPLYGGVA
ncbi:hypothetical protein D9M71_675460 [compost metagenome]